MQEEEGRLVNLTSLFATSTISVKNWIAGLNFSCISHKKNSVESPAKFPSLVGAAIFLL